MSPEQAQGQPIHRRADIHSFAVVLYEMIAGRLPFPAGQHSALIHSILNVEPEPLTALRTGVPMSLERLVRKAMAKIPANAIGTWTNCSWIFARCAWRPGRGK